MSNPSLILPQSPAYGEDYVYAAQVNDGVVPLYNVLPLTFTRASGGTRINKDGLVQNMPYNLLNYSEDFTNAFWNKATNGSATFTVTANQTTAPNGTNTADLISITRSATSELSCVYTMVGQGVGTFKGSIWLKAKDSSNVGKTIDLWSWEGDTRGYTKVTLTADWVRYDQNTTVFTGTGSELFDFGLLPISYSTSTTLAVEFYAWGAQSNIGSTAQPYLATTDRLNMPRITYPVGGGCGALLLEKQSTNLCTYSNDISNASYNYQNASVSGVTITSPDGTSNAYGIVADTSTNNFHRWYKSFGAISGTYTTAIYAKKGTSKYFGIGWNQDGSTGNNNIVVYNLDAGTVASNPYSVTASIENAGNGWYRCVHTFNFGTGGSFADLCVHNAGLLSNYTAAAFQVYDSPSVSTTLYVWGVQVEASSYATSYIPTTSTSATRIADVCYKTGISNIIGQSEGTVFVDFVLKNDLSSVNRVVSITDTNWLSGGSFRVDINATYAVCEMVYNNAALVVALTDNTTYLPNTRYKIAFAYKVNDFVMYVNGTLRASSTSMANVPTCSQFYLNELGGGFGGPWQPTEFNNAQLFTTRISNAELATLTTI